MIDIESEELGSLNKAAKWFPTRPHCSTVWRWGTRGVRGVHLDTVTIGGRRYTSREAVQRFLEATQATTSQSVSARSVTGVPSRRRRQIDQAEAYFRETGA